MRELPPHEVLQQVTGAYILSRCLQTVADLRVADHLDNEPETAETLAKAVVCDPKALGRVLNLLSAHGVFERQNGRFTHTPTSRLLRGDHPQSMRAFVRMFGLPMLWQTAMKLDHALTSGQSVASEVIPGGFWAYLAADAQANRLFDEAMTAKAQAQISAVVAAYDFSKFGTVADIGGGRGHLLEAILKAYPKSEGVLFDLPQVVEQVLHRNSDRLIVCGGDFFRDQLPSTDAYVIMEVIHDWPDRESQMILKSVRRAAPKHAKLLLVEAPIPPEPGPSWTKTLDIVMLYLFGGGQRTSEEYRKLLTDSGFRLDREIGIGTDYSIFEASVV